MGSCYHECPIDDSEEYVSVPVVYGETTWRTALSQLASVVDYKKITHHSKLIIYTPTTDLYAAFFNLIRLDPSSVGSAKFQRIFYPPNPQSSEYVADYTFLIEEITFNFSPTSAYNKYTSYRVSTLNSSYNATLDRLDTTISYNGELRLYY